MNLTEFAMAKVVNLESTPNPNALKYIVDAPLTTGDSRSFASLAEAESSGDALAISLLRISGVTSVYYMDRFVTLSKTEAVSFHALHPQAVAAIEKSASGALPVAVSTQAAAEAAAELAHLSPEERAMMEKINAVLNSDVRPALAGDGGGLVVLGLDNNVLKIKYQGACGSCPSATAGTIAAIQNVLRFKVNPELSVVPG